MQPRRRSGSEEAHRALCILVAAVTNARHMRTRALLGSKADGSYLGMLGLVMSRVVGGRSESTLL